MIYLDHNATSPLRPAAKAAAVDAMEAAGNASSVHRFGREARARIERAREAVARFSDSDIQDVVFTSGGSEANVLALRGAITGAAEAGKRITRIIVSAIEHDSVRATAAQLAESNPGLKLLDIPVSPNGMIDAAALRLMLMQGKGRVLVCVMAANNETGVIQDLHEVAALVRQEGGPDALLHIDAVQAMGQIPFSFAETDADYVTISAHKLGGPQGAGALIAKPAAPLSPQILGGGQEFGRRAGTENVAAIAGFGAVAETAEEIRSGAARSKRMRDEFEVRLKEIAPDAVIFGAGAERLPNTCNFAIPGLASETALIALDLDGIAVSSGAACSSGKVKTSHVLSAMGVAESVARCGIRISFGWTNRESDIDSLVVSLRRLVERRAALAA